MFYMCLVKWNKACHVKAFRSLLAVIIEVAHKKKKHSRVNKLTFVWYLFVPTVLFTYLRWPKCLVKVSRVSTAATLDIAKSFSSGKWEKAALCKMKKRIIGAYIYKHILTCVNFKHYVISFTILSVRLGSVISRDFSIHLKPDKKTGCPKKKPTANRGLIETLLISD